ncbi:hypothetical protein Clacol_004524 [Clathrus columnatus]|uniref:Uncharacterized protein n=1 Tax=Clathrus columnatus TaxID=1419009 RepID=A0AAV5AAU1_9AGAM|nr:hypothetical protein Clacol_004524 [Clathrus columnatus]
MSRSMGQLGIHESSTHQYHSWPHVSWRMRQRRFLFAYYYDIILESPKVYVNSLLATLSARLRLRESDAGTTDLHVYPPNRSLRFDDPPNGHFGGDITTVTSRTCHVNGITPDDSHIVTGTCQSIPHDARRVDLTQDRQG